MNSFSWNIHQVWNSAFEDPNIGGVEQEAVARDYIYASELGKAPADVVLRMHGVTPTNPPDARTRRKFEAGLVWEKIFEFVFTRAGILQERQGKVVYKIGDLPSVVGKYDFVAGGKIDFEKARRELEVISDIVPQRMLDATKRVVENLSLRFPSGELPVVVFETKSVSAFMFDERLASEQPQESHGLQIYHYLLGGDYNEGHIVYIDRDSARLLEFGVLCPSERWGGLYEAAVRSIFEAYNNYKNSGVDGLPKESPVLFDENTCKFSLNWRFGYSEYLSMLYGLSHQEEYREKYEPLVASWNRVLTRVGESKNMTDKNNEALAEIEKMFGKERMEQILSLVRKKFSEKEV